MALFKAAETESDTDRFAPGSLSAIPAWHGQVGDIALKSLDWVKKMGKSFGMYGSPYPFAP